MNKGAPSYIFQNRWGNNRGDPILPLEADHPRGAQAVKSTLHLLQAVKTAFIRRDSIEDTA